MLPISPLLLEFSSHQLEVAETLIQVGRFVVIFLAARAIAEVMVRLQLPTILGELVAGVLIGVSGLHLIVPPETQAQLSAGVAALLASLAQISPDAAREVYSETFCLLCCFSPDWRVSSMSWWLWASRPPRWLWAASCCPLP